jgi:HAD superfamily hydrolase (TIGR01509 family)
MDGVIVDSETHWKQLEGFFLQSLVSSWGVADQGRITGLSLHDLYNLLISEYRLTLPKEQFLDLYHEMAVGIYANKVSLIEGFGDVLDFLLANDIPVALASSSPMRWIDIVLDRFDLRPAFRVVVSADELEGQGKPSPAIYLLTAQRLGVPPDQCIVIEDSRNGVLSARRAGMFCIGFRNGFNEEQDLSDADMLVHGYAGLDLTTLRRLLQIANSSQSA